MDIHKTTRCRMKRTKKLCMTLVAAVVVGLGATAHAQETPPPSSPPPSSGGGGVSAIGGGAGAGIGIGAAVLLADTTAPGALPAAQFVYDMNILHFEGLFGFFSREINGMGDRQTDFVFGAGGWYHLHRGAASDFSLGAVIAIATNSGPGPSSTITAFEPGVTVRAFVTPNVAAFARAGLAFQFGDTGNGTNIRLGGQPTGSFGFTYFFR
jgi:hypothetical protein